MKILIVFFVIAFSVQINGQDRLITADNKKIFDNAAQESVFVHYNSSFYMVGEYLYYKVYCLNAETKKLSQVSKMAYLELIAENGQRVFRQKVRLENGLGQGDFFLPVSVVSGNYKLVAYTKWMYNWEQDIFFKGDIVIVNPYSNIQKDFLNIDSVTNEMRNESVVTLPSSKSLKSNEDPMKLLLSKKKFGKREVVNIQIQGKNSKKNPQGNYSLSILKYDTIFPNFKKTATGHIASTKVSSRISRDFFLPELRGELISGKVVADNPNKLVNNLKVAFSIPGEDYQLKITSTDALGQFYFNIERSYQSEEAMIQLLEENNDGYIIEIDDSSSHIDTNNFDFKTFKINTKMNNLILERSVQNQIENAYFKVKPDTIVSKEKMLKFYGENSKTYLLDDYTRFSTIKETVLEILDNVWLTKTNDENYYFSLRTLNGEFNNSEFRSLLLVDGLLVKEQDYFIKNYNSDLIKRINIVREYYRMGSQIFDGIIDIQTFDIDYLEVVKKNNLTILKLKKQTEIKNYFRQVYENESTRNLEQIPDQRRQLLWLPNLKIKNQDQAITFFTSDLQGDFEISLEGFTDTGKPVSVRKIISVE